MAGKYTWETAPDKAVWSNSRFDTVEECVADALGCGCQHGEKIAIGICEDFEVRVDVDLLLDNVAEQTYEELGEVAEGFPYFESGKGYKGAAELDEKINKVFKEWLEETGQTPGFYKVAPCKDMVEL